jgi:hypothetical protein
MGMVRGMQAVCGAEVRGEGRRTHAPRLSSTRSPTGRARAQEWLRGGHLFDKLEEMAGQHYSEQQASILFTQARPARGVARARMSEPGRQTGPHETRPLRQPYATERALDQM